jgi:predicted nucleotidyltransferase
MSEPVTTRRDFSRRRLDELTAGLSDLSSLLDEAQLCIYATGSYGRLEAWNGSDIDLFFIYEDTEAFSFLTFLRVAGRLVERTEEMGFPPFSGDGKYLESLDVNEMERILGSREDDSANAFTARMLLLLESQPISDQQRYQRLIDRVVGFYFRDLEGHERDFVPTFLTNDILRFWRTLTLNYEHDRFSVGQLEGTAQDQARSKSSLKNYKLKVSRLATCYSMVTHLACEPAPVTREQVVALCAMTPMERFRSLEDRDGAADALLTRLADAYDEFLSNVQKPDEELAEQFMDRDVRQQRLKDAAQFGATIFQLVETLVPDGRLRHLVV